MKAYIYLHSMSYCSPAPTSEYLSLSLSAGFCCLTSQAKCIGLKPPPLTCAQFPGVGPTGWFPCWCWLGLLLISGQLQGARLLSPWHCCLLTWAMESTGPGFSSPSNWLKQDCSRGSRKVPRLGWISLHVSSSYVSASSAPAWKIPWTEEPGGLQSMGSLRVRHGWVASLSLFTFMHWRRNWQPTPVFLPGESQGWGSLVGCHLWGRTESDTTEAT